MSPEIKTAFAEDKRAALSKLLFSEEKKKRIKFLSREIPARLSAMLLFFESEKEITPADLHEHFNISRQTLSRDIAIFRKLAWVEFKGETIGGVCRLTSNGIK